MTESERLGANLNPFEKLGVDFTVALCNLLGLDASSISDVDLSIDREANILDPMPQHRIALSLSFAANVAPVPAAAPEPEPKPAEAKSGGFLGGVAAGLHALECVVDGKIDDLIADVTRRLGEA